MPEGHTIHRAALDQRPMLVGKILDVASPQGRFADGAAELDGNRCVAIEAYGKHMLYYFEQDLTLHIVGLGIDPDSRVRDAHGRPHAVVEGGRPMVEWWG